MCNKFCNCLARPNGHKHRNPMNYMNKILFLFCFFVLKTVIWSVDENHLNIIFPETLEYKTNLSKIRISGNTNKNNKVYINGRETKVYTSGGFASIVDLKDNQNKIVVESKNKQGKKFVKELRVHKITHKTSPNSPIEIDLSYGVEPEFSTNLLAGDTVKIRFKGSPGCKASATNQILLDELSPEDANGIKGVYEGYYTIKEFDYLEDVPLTLRLENPKGEIAMRYTDSLISLNHRDYPMVGITKGEFPFLTYSLDKDRLGSAKLGYLDKNVKLKIIGKIGDMYKVGLSEGMEAYIPDENVEIRKKKDSLRTSIVGSVSITGDTKFDYITVNVGDRVPYMFQEDIDPKKFSIVLFGVKANTNWVHHQDSSKLIKNLIYVQDGKDRLRISVELHKSLFWGLKMYYDSKNLVIRVKREPASLELKDLTFIIDAGHGGDNAGAIGSTGVMEKDVNLKVAQILKRQLETAGAKVIMTRQLDKNIKNQDRLNQILKSDGDILISIHANSVSPNQDPEKGKGISTFYKYIAFRPLSTFIYNQILKLGLHPYGNVSNFNFALNSTTEIPNTLVEMAFLTNPEDEIRLLDPNFHHQISERIFLGIIDFLNYTKLSTGVPSIKFLEK